MSSLLLVIGLLICSNTFMTFAWYAHLKNYSTKPIIVVILLSWGLAFFEYLFMIPANRIGYEQAQLNLAQLKIIQEIITLSVFVPFAILFMGQKITWNYLGAGICLLGAVYFIFKQS